MNGSTHKLTNETTDGFTTRERKDVWVGRQKKSAQRECTEQEYRTKSNTKKWMGKLAPAAFLGCVVHKLRHFHYRPSYLL